MEMVLNNGFCEMSQEEEMVIDGGWDWGTVLTGTSIVVACVGLTISTGGIGFCSIPLIIGAGTATEIAVAGVAVAGTVVGSAAIGYGVTH